MMVQRHLHFRVGTAVAKVIFSIGTIAKVNMTSVTAPAAPNYQSIARIIAGSGVCSRREAEKWIRAKRVEVNGEVCPSAALKYDLSTKPSVLVDGVSLRSSSKFEKVRIWAMHKRTGELVDTKDEGKGRVLALDRIKPLLGKDSSTYISAVKPVYRLEYNVEGLCLFTDSGKLSRFLDSNELNLARHYRVRVNGSLTDSKLQGLRRGIIVDGVKLKPMDVTVQNSSGTMSWVGVTCYENRNRVIQRAFKKLFLNITRVICVGFGPFRLSDIASAPEGVVEIKLPPDLNGRFLKSNYKR